MSPRPEDIQATFCATLVDEWRRCGVEHAVMSPGSRSTPLMLALAAADGIELHVHHDERSAGFMAIGLALVSWEPTVLVTTSGTATAELHAAVVEADLAAVPLLVCTADRPEELVDVGAPQAIDQIHLYGGSVRWFHAPGVAEEAARARWRPLAARAYAEATGSRPGPVHLNLAFREPLVGTSQPLPEPRSLDGAPWVWRPPIQVPVDPVISVSEDLAGRRGVVVAGPGSGDGDLVRDLASRLGWPVLAAPQAPVWSLPGAIVPAADAILRVADRHAELQPDVVLRLGGPLASRVVGEWLASTGATEIVVAGTGTWSDPHATASVVLDADPGQMLVAWADELVEVAPAEGGRWLRTWQDLGAAAQQAIVATLAAEPGPTEPGTAGALVGSLPEGATLVVSSSMPIRDLEWYVTSAPCRVLANRGANGIDGVVSTAVGAAAASGGPTALLIGDVAFLHDANGLLGAVDRGLDLVVVVIDNDGGGIFSFLPQAGAVAPAVFETLYGTPHGLDLAALASVYGATARAVEGDVAQAVRAAVDAGGLHVLVVRTDRAANVDLHRRINEAVAAAIAG